MPAASVYTVDWVGIGSVHLLLNGASSRATCGTGKARTGIVFRFRVYLHFIFSFMIMDFANIILCCVQGKKVIAWFHVCGEI